jgi:TonB family protein
VHCLRRLILITLATAGRCTVLVAVAHAQPQEAAAEEARAAAVSPPRLKRFVEAPYPPGAEPSTEPVGVLLELTIDEQGRVAAAQITQSGGEQFDQAALEAVKQFEFEPARRAGAPVAVRLSYRYVFEQPSTPRRPAEPEPARERAAQPPPSARQSPAAEPAPSSPPSAVEPSSPVFEFGTTAEIEAPPRETTKRVVEQEKLTRIPGTGGDALRAVEVMPGVARTSIASGDPILRGAAWNDSTSFVDGTPVPLLYHFGGVKSSFNSHLLERVEFFPGNFSARFGRVTGGVIDARARDPRLDRLHGMVDLSLLDSSALMEGPVGDDLGFALAARRSNIDFFFESFVPEDAYNVVAAPLYWDYQALGTYRINPQHRLRLMGYGCRDSIRLLFSDPSVFDPGLRGAFEIAIEYHRVQANLDSQLSSEVSQNLQVAYGTQHMSQTVGPIDARFDLHEVYGRGEWGIQASPELKVNLGFDVQSQALVGKYKGGPPPQAEGDPNLDSTLAAEEVMTVEVEDDFIAIVRPAGYVELEIRPISRLLLVPGLRFDYYGYVGEYSIDPRLSTRYEVTDTTTAKWGVGIYSQPPIYYEAIPGFTNPDIKPFYALHTSIGVEQQLSSELEVGVEGFYKRLIDRIVSTPGGHPPRLVNDGVGRIYGAELSAKYQSRDTYGYLAYTLSHSERRDRNGPWRLFEKDQTHILSVVMSHKLGRGWEAGARFRLVSGDPDTPVVGAVYDAGIDQYRPLHGPIFSEREPLFHQLDLRVEKQWSFSDWSLAAYLDVQNAYNAKHIEGTDYSFDYSESRGIEGMPIFPNLGIRGEI